MRLLLSSMHARCQRLAAVGGHTFRSDRSSSGCLLQAGKRSCVEGSVLGDVLLDPFCFAHRLV